jgi:hypothetical protein
MAEFKGKTFENENVILDGNEYVGCTFSNCELVYGASGDVRIVKSKTLDCHWTFIGAAAKTMRFLGGMYQLGPDMQRLVDQSFEFIRGSVSDDITVH